MTSEIITIESGKINNYLHHVDLKEYGIKRFLSCFIAEFDNYNVIIDCGSSHCIRTLLRYMKRNEMSLSRVKYLITTHHHFDHAGGMWKLYEEIKKINPDVKILTNETTKELLIDFKFHLSRAIRNFGDSVGEMKPIEEGAFQIIEPSIKFNKNPDSLDYIEIFKSNGSEVKLSILKTPGHTHDHQCPLFIKDDTIDFIFFGEAVGTLYNTKELISMPTSMAVYYQHEVYMKTLQNLKKLSPKKAGIGHFGVINEEKNISQFLLDNESFMKDYRNKIAEYYQEKPETKYIVDKIIPMLAKRTDRMKEDNLILRNVVLGTVYGMMMDLGFRKE